jgi:hypothetical protein
VGGGGGGVDAGRAGEVTLGEWRGLGIEQWLVPHLVHQICCVHSLVEDNGPQLAALVHVLGVVAPAAAAGAAATGGVRPSSAHELVIFGQWRCM